MTPQEIFEHKSKWRSNGWTCWVDPDADVWTKVWCKRHVPKQSWSFQPYDREDDWHSVSFEFREDYEYFKSSYNIEHRVQI